MTEKPIVQTSGLDDLVPITSVPGVLTAEHYALQPHPLVPLPTEEEARAFLARPGGDVELTKLLNDRGQLIYLMETDPYNYGAELEHWQDADAQLRLSQLLYTSGGKRAGKSEWACKRMVESCMTYGNGKRWVFQDSITTSIAMQQQLFWKYLPQEIKNLNGQKRGGYKVRWSPDGGFTDRILVLPNGTEVYFLVYNQEVKDFQGWELGSRISEERLKRTADGRVIENIGAWMDENLTVPWLETIKFRLATRGAKGIWTFSTTDGITSTIKAFLGTPKTLETRPAELLSDRVNLPGLPLGHMPYIQEPMWPRARVIYFFSQRNPFSGYTEPGGIKELCAGRSSSYVMMNAYGYAEDVGKRAFPLFGEWNITKPEHLPAEGTNYMAADPAGARNWATIWIRVAPGNPSSIYIYREWPDFQRYGEWAVTSANPNKMDGDPGPAQPSLGYGPAEYKKMFLKEECLRRATTEKERDPYRVLLLERAQADGADLGQVFEKIRERLIDPRAGKNQHAVDKGGVCLVDKLAAVDRDKEGQVAAPGMLFTPARGVDIEDGVSQINTLLWWDKEKDLEPLLNYPRLFVSENCKQVIWALQNWTGNDGQTGACKDFIDLLRYLVTWDVRHITPGRVRTTGGGSY